MKPARIIAFFITTLLATSGISAHGATSNQQNTSKKIDGSIAGKSQKPEQASGLVKLVVVKSKTICIDSPGKGQMLFTFTNSTRFENAASYKNIQPNQHVTIEFTKSGAANIATLVSLVLVKLPVGVQQVSTDEMKEITNKITPENGVIIYDARPLSNYNQSHIPGALSLPSTESQTPENSKKVAIHLPKDKNRPIIFYCEGPTRGFAATAAAVALKNGHSNVKVYYEGYPGWQNADMAFASSPKFIKESAIILIDLRSPKDYESGHIPGALNIPTEKFLAITEKSLPDFKETPIVFYGSQLTDTNSAIEVLRDFAFTKITFFPGSAERWKKLGYPLETGAKPTPEKLVYARNLAQNEVSIGDFKKALLNNSAIIIDARTKDEYAAGSFKGAVNIPFDDIAGRYTEVPSNKPVFIHCANGSRAAIAYAALKEKGYTNIRLLRAVINFTNGNYTITE